MLTCHALILDLQSVAAQSVVTAVQQLKEALEELTESLGSIDEELEAHEERYFASWRSPDVAGRLVRVSAASGVLDKRLDTLQKVAVISNQLRR